MPPTLEGLLSGTTPTMVLRQKLRIADDDQQGLGPGDGDVEPLLVAQESDIRRVDRRTDGRQDHDQPLLTLKLFSCSDHDFGSSVC